MGVKDVMADGLPALRLALAEPPSNGKRMIKYKRMHRLLAEGNFLLCISEGFRNGVHSSFYDLFCVADGKLVEHWDTTEAIPPAHRMEKRAKLSSRVETLSSTGP